MKSVKTLIVLYLGEGRGRSRPFARARNTKRIILSEYMLFARFRRGICRRSARGRGALSQFLLRLKIALQYKLCSYIINHMAYTSLYRRYRPDTFRDVIGQDHVVRTLVNQIKSGNIGHAYLFTGTRGTGKTSVAKIFSRAVNCLAPEDGSPCGKCEVCMELALSGNFDILEIDAASNNSVDQIRELTDKINFPPTAGKYKVYIIDEVHMLSKSAHNALLKTLEEPPEHAIFILATTEVHAIPATILSRCMRFDFRLVPLAKIADRLKFIFDDNGVKYSEQAVRMIASAGQGSVRDALSIADMCVSYCSGDITYEGVLEVLGTSDPVKLVALAEDILACNVEGALSKISAMCDLGKSMAVLASDLATLFRNALYVKNCGDAAELLALPNELYAALKELSSRYDQSRLLAAMRRMTEMEGEFRYSTQHRILLEAAVIAAATEPRAEHGGDTRELEQKVAAIAKRVNALSRSGFEPAPAAKDAGQVWGNVASELQRMGVGVLAIAAAEAKAEEHEDALVVKVSSESAMRILSDPANRKLLSEAAAKYSAKPLRIEEVRRIEENKVIPYLTGMFGKSLEIT